MVSLYLGGVGGGSSGKDIDLGGGGGGEVRKLLSLDHLRHNLESNFSYITRCTN